MSFFFNNPAKKRKHPKGTRQGTSLAKSRISTKTMDKVRSMGCKACTLDRARCSTPKMRPTGPRNPLVYVLSSYISRDTDLLSQHLSSDSERVLLKAIGRRADDCRFNAITQCYSGKTAPGALEVECCRGRIEEDILDTQPYVILGVGYQALLWAQKKDLVGGIFEWRGKPFPIRIEDHTCWFVPVLDFDLLKDQRENKRYQKDTMHDFMLQLDVDRAFDYVNKDPVEVQTEGFLDGCHYLHGTGTDDFIKLQNWIDLLVDKEVVAVDLEGTALRPYASGAELSTLAIGDEEECYAFPIEHKKGWKLQKRRKQVWELVRDFLHHDVVKVCHNLKFEQEWFIELFGERVLRCSGWEDTMSQAYVIDERKHSHSLGFLTTQYFGFNVKKLSPKLDFANLNEHSLDDVLPYNALDAKYTFKLFIEQDKVLSDKKNNRLIPTYNYHVELSPALALAQKRGMFANMDKANKIGEDLEVRVKTLLRKLNKIPEVVQCAKKFGEYNPGSPDHNLYILDNLYGVKEIQMPNGSRSTDERVLSQLVEDYPFAKLLLEWRGLSKLKGTYIDSLPGYIYPDGIIHTNYNHTFTSTGRLSSEDPNNQNWPSRKYAYIREIIEGETTLEGEVTLVTSFDYGQIDARNIAMASEDEYYINALWDGLDIHQDWTERIIRLYPEKLDEMAPIYGIDRDDESKLVNRYRKDIKNQWTFPLFYGCSADAASYHTQLPQSVVDPLFREFWDTFSGVRKWIDKTIKSYLRTGYVETLNGRRRHGPMKREELINAAIQGTTAEVVGDAMIRCSQLAYPNDFEGRVWCPDRMWQPFIQIHDDLGFYIPNNDKFEENALNIARVMCDVPFDWVSVPIVVEMKAGLNWYDQSMYKKEYSSADILEKR